MQSSIKKIGNSAGVVIPKTLLAELGAKAGDRVDLLVEGDHLVIRPARRAARAGWADDAQRIATLGDDALVWPEFANEGDDELTW